MQEKKPIPTEGEKTSTKAQKRLQKLDEQNQNSVNDDANMASENVDQDTGEISEKDGGKTLLDHEKIEKPLAKTCNFELLQLQMRNARWEMHIKTYRTLMTLYKNYDLTLIVNLDPIDEKIDLALKRMSKGAQRDIEGRYQSENEYQSLLNTKDELIRNCPDILFPASVISTKYFDDGSTGLTFLISPDIINTLNDKRNYMANYKIKLEPINVSKA